jgi:predicted pyridoxine 5'-phosphate oxidase superfamily flavin-nucleotide-binding protein
MEATTPDGHPRPGSDGEHTLQRILGTEARADRFYREQMRDRLNTRMAEFISYQEMVFISTADGHGECDASLRAGPPGFVEVLDDRTLAYPEYRGNGVMASLGNLAENAHIGLLFVDFVRDVIGLHVNGTARVRADPDMRGLYPWLDEDEVPGRRPEMWVVVTVEEAYIHCSKHIPRLAKVPRGRSWGTDDLRRKGGDFFGAAAEAGARWWRRADSLR